MSYNGSGAFSINTAGQPVVSGTTISSTVFNALTADLATGLSTAICKDGQTTTSAAIPFALGITLSGTASNIATGSNFISNGGTDAGLSFDASNNATLSANLIASGTGPYALGGATDTRIGIRLITTSAAATGTAAGLHVGPTMTASGNNVGMMGFGIGVVADDTTFATGAFTGLEAIQLRVAGGASMVKTGTGTIDAAAAFKVNDAPTIGTVNYAIWVAAGKVLVGAGITIGTNTTNSLIDDSSTGAGSTTLYIGNASINVTSDENLKRNITPLQDGLSIVRALLPIEFDQDLERPLGDVQHYVGFGARRSHKVAPWAVNTQGDTGLPWHMRQEFLMAPAIRALQQLDERISALEAK